MRPRRGVYVGGPTVKAILANMMAPGLLDRLLARKGYEGQLTDELEAPNRSDNLFNPVANHHAARGRFDERAKKGSLELWTTEHRGAVALGACLLMLTAGFGMARRLAP